MNVQKLNFKYLLSFFNKKQKLKYFCFIWISKISFFSTDHGSIFFEHDFFFYLTFR